MLNFRTEENSTESQKTFQQSELEKHRVLKEKVVELSHSLEESENEEFIKENIPVLFDLINKDLGIEIIKDQDVNKIYKKLQEENCLVRVEKLSKIMEVLELDKPFKVGEGGEDFAYANSVIPEPEGLKIAFAEGHASGTMKLALALGKHLIGFKANGKYLKVSEVDFSNKEDVELRDVQKRNYLCRHIDGMIEKEDIRAVVLRIPRHLMKNELLTDDELNTSTSFIFRGFFVNENI